MSDEKRGPESDDALFRGIVSAMDGAPDLEEPSPHIDERIYAMARAELDVRARGERRRVRWIELGAAAAVLLVAVLLFRDWNMEPRSVDDVEPPQISSGAVVDFATALLDEERDQDRDTLAPPVAVARLRADFHLLARMARAAPIENDIEKHQIIERLDRGVSDLDKLEARLGMTIRKNEQVTPEEGGPR